MTYDGIKNAPFDPDVRDLEPETKTLDYVILEAMRRHTLQMRVAMPGFVLGVRSTGVVDVQPAFQQRFRSDNSTKDLPIVLGVPVCLPSGAQYAIKVPIAVGDSGLLVFCDRALDTWCAGDGSRTVDPADARQHTLSDAIFLPGCWPGDVVQQDDTSDLVVTSGQMQMRLLQSGQVSLGSTADGGQELVSVLDDFMAMVGNLIQTLQTAQTLTLIGGQPFIAATQVELSQLSTQAAQIKQNLETLKGA